MEKVKKSSSPKKVRKNSKRTAKRARSNGSAANRKMMAKKRRISRKANYGARKIRKANWVHQDSTPVGGIRGAVLSAVLILTLFLTRRSTSEAPKVVSQTDGKNQQEELER